MAKIRFHKIAALAVLALSAAWVLTGEFSAIGSASGEPQGASQKKAEPVSTQTKSTPALKTVAVVVPPFIEHSRAIRLSGNTAADKSATLATRTGGIIAELPVRQGQKVKQGDLILSLETEGKQAVVETARALLVQREKEFEASERLARKGSLPKLQLDTARSALAAARSQLEQAEADLDRFQIRAPFAGVIDRVMVEQGSSVGQGAQVALLLQLDPVIATGEVSERDIASVAIGMKADVRLITGQTVAGRVRYISRQASAQTRTFPVEVEIANAEGAVPAGMTAEIVLRTEPVHSVVLPRSVVTLSDNGDLGIRIVKTDSTVGFVPIDIVDDMSAGLVLGGVPDDARIIVAGQDLAAEGEKVNAVEADPALVKRLVGEVTGAVN